MQLSGIIARTIGLRITSGRYKPGDVLRGEIEMCDRLRVSRGAYREAVQTLAAKGLVRALRKAGTRVTPREEWHVLDPDVLEWILEVGPEDSTVESMLELRRMLEPDVAALAATRHTQEDLLALSSAFKAMTRRRSKPKAARLAGAEFHVALLRATGNVFVASLARSLGAAAAWAGLRADGNSRQSPESLAAYQRLYDAIALRDREAARVAMIELATPALHDRT